ncbi:MAG: hypothetical protein JNN07_17425 [Verrucomicrobiales bacterium]|nr:hypothetical protein [Verrucomicrobiales bacterium]
MFAYVTTFEHPWFAVTDTNGMYRLPPLEPGEHVICAQHRQRKLYEKVRVDETGSPQTLDFYFEETDSPTGGSAKILSE